LAGFLLDQREEQAFYLTFMHLMHRAPLEEVLAMRRMTPEELEIDAETLVQACGEEGVIELLGEDRALQILLHRLGKERLQQTLERLTASENEPAEETDR
jgi:hypothetical protein